MTTSLKQITCKYHRNQQENVKKHPGRRSINILTFVFTFIATIGHSIVDRQYLQLGQDQEAVNSPNEAFKWFYAGPDRSQDLLSLLDAGWIAGKSSLISGQSAGWSQTTAPRYAGPGPGALASQIVYRFLARKLKFSSAQNHKQTRWGEGGCGEGGRGGRGRLIILLL